MLIIHGENTLASRRTLNNEISLFRLQKKGEVIRFDSNLINLTTLKQALESKSLFSTDKLIIIEKVFTAKSKEKEVILKYLKQENFNNLIIWEDKKINIRTLATLQATVQLFDLPVLLFKLLDNFYPQNNKNLLSLYHQTLVGNAAQLIFFLLCRQVKQLIIGVSYPAALGSMQDWRKNKIVTQANRFGLVNLKQIYQEMLKIEWEDKNGLSGFPLATRLDVFLADI